MRRAAPWAVLAAALVAIAVLGRGGDDSGEPLDPRSTGPAGARALVLLLDRLGATVSIAPVASGDVAVVLVDDLAGGQRGRLESWVRGGGTLVVADPRSPLVALAGRAELGRIAAGGPEDAVLRRDCAIDALAGVDQVSVPRAVALVGRPGTVGCYAVAGGHYVVVGSVGRGTVVAVGGAGAFTNDRLGERDNAALAAGLLSGRPGARVTVLDGDLPGAGDRTLADLLPGGVRRGLWQLVAAFAFVVAWRGRRLEPAAADDVPVPIPASELVVATADLLHKAGRRDEAAAMLRRRLVRDLAPTLGLARTASAADAARLLAARGTPPGLVAAALDPRPIDRDDELVRLAGAVDALRDEVTHA